MKLTAAAATVAIIIAVTKGSRSNSENGIMNSQLVSGSGKNRGGGSGFYRPFVVVVRLCSHYSSSSSSTG